MVVVHKLIASGTIEENMDAMLEEKAGLSEEIVLAMHHTRIHDMDNQQLMDLLRLSV